MAYCSTQPREEDLTSFLQGDGPGGLASVDRVDTSSSSFSLAHSSFIFSRDVSQNTSHSSLPAIYFQSQDDSSTQATTYASSASSCPFEDDELPAHNVQPTFNSFGTSTSSSFTFTHTRQTAIQFALRDLRRGRYAAHNPTCRSQHYAIRITVESDGAIIPKRTQRRGHADKHQLRQSTHETEIHFPTSRLRVSGGIATKKQIYNSVVSSVASYFRDWADERLGEDVESIRLVIDAHTIRLFVVPRPTISQTWTEEEEKMRDTRARVRSSARRMLRRRLDWVDGMRYWRMRSRVTFRRGLLSKARGRRGSP